MSRKKRHSLCCEGYTVFTQILPCDLKPKEFRLFKPAFHVDYKGWHMEGDFWEWDYGIMDATRQNVAQISKELLHLTDTYVIDVWNPENALEVLMLVLAIDAEKCSRN